MSQKKNNGNKHPYHELFTKELVHWLQDNIRNAKTELALTDDIIIDALQTTLRNFKKHAKTNKPDKRSEV